MYPSQLMDLAWLDHQERLQKAQRDLPMRQIRQKSLFRFWSLNREKTKRISANPASIQCDTVAVN